jgi:predicted nucleic-acid-binding protein
MIGLDTNILVRYIMQDDPNQASLASKLIDACTAQAPGFITIVSVIELVWVLESCYAKKRADIALVLHTMLAADNLKLEQKSIVAGAVKLFSSSRCDFADCLIVKLSEHHGCRGTFTFDRHAANTSGMQLLQLKAGK